MEPFAAVEIIAAKRDRNELTDKQIDWTVDAYTRGVIADEQMSALLMAILLNGMNSREISRWTTAMINSGGGRLIAFTCVDISGNLLMPCGRCRQLLQEHGGSKLQLATDDGIKTLADLLPWAFGPEEMEKRLD